MRFTYTPVRGLIRFTDKPTHVAGEVDSGPGFMSFGPSPPHGSPQYTVPMASQTIDTNSTAVTITNSTVEQTVVSVAAPSLTIRSEGMTRLVASGKVRNATGAGTTLLLNVKVNDGTGLTSVLATTAVSVSSSTNSRWWNLEALMFGRAPNSQTHWGSVVMSDPTAATLAPPAYSSVGYSTSDLDDLQPITVTVTAKLDNASTNASFTMEGASFEAITG